MATREPRTHWARHLADLLKAVELVGRPGGATVDELAQRLGQSKRTAYRVIRALEDLNFPLLEESPGDDGKRRHRLDPSYVKRLPNLTVPELKLTLPEIVALSFLRQEGSLFRGTDVERNVRSAFTKFDAFLPERFAKQLEKVRTLFVAPARFAKDYRGKQPVIDSLTDAMLGQRTCLVEYHSFGDDQVKCFKIDPLQFFERDGGLYCFVRATSFGNTLALAVERIHALTVTDATFKAPKGFDAARLLEGAFNLTLGDPVKVKVRISADQARYVKERRWAAKQTLTDQPDGSVILEMETSGRWDVKRWVLERGADAELLEPADLRAEIAAEVKAMEGLYSRARKGK